jgi:hypothetical protein
MLLSLETIQWKVQFHLKKLNFKKLAIEMMGAYSPWF